MPTKKSPVEEWKERETAEKRKALQDASGKFKDGDALNINSLRSIYGQESSFGTKRGKRNSDGPAGDFQMEKKTAIRMGLKVNREVDERFIIHKAAPATAEYLEILDKSFSQEKILIPRKLKTIPIVDSNERLKFTIAAHNAGEGRIARAQQKAKAAGKNPAKWDDVKQFLKDAGSTDAKVKEIQDYVDKVLIYSTEFHGKAERDKTKGTKLKKSDDSSKEGHWITKDHHHILVKD